jgi:hypothetical protein
MTVTEIWTGLMAHCEYVVAAHGNGLTARWTAVPARIPMPNAEIAATNRGAAWFKGLVFRDMGKYSQFRRRMCSRICVRQAAVGFFIAVQQYKYERSNSEIFTKC